MQSIKLHEATKQFKITNKLAMFFLESKNVPVKSHSSVISMEQLELLREFSGNKEKFAAVVDEFEKMQKAKKRKPPVETKKEEIPQVEKEVEQPVPEKPAKEEEAKPKPVPESIKKVEKPKPTPPAVEKPELRKPTPKVEKKEIREIKQERPVKPVPPPVTPKRRIERVPPAQPQPKPRIQPHPPQRLNRRPPKDRVIFTPDRRKAKHHPKPASRPSTIKPKVEKLDLPELIQVPEFITVKELCEELNIKLRHVDEKLKCVNKDYSSNQILDKADIEEICKSFGVSVEITSYEKYTFQQNIESKDVKLVHRAPIVTVMGHVDHGKTTLLDSLRKTRVADREAGGITQSIGAYKLNINNNDVIFIDTPGHEAFTNLRARGAKVTDIVVLVVAANEGVKPQTKEAIDHALAAEVPIIVAINKIDLDGADVNKVKTELSKHNILVEDWGGDIVSVEISAKLNQNLDTLLEMINLVAEMQELKCYQDVPARGTVVESRLDPKLGPVATVLIQDGFVKRGDFFICGNSTGKVKSIFNDTGGNIATARAPEPVEIMGFEIVPEAGDLFQIVTDLDRAKKIIDIRKMRDLEAREDEIKADKKLSLQNLFQKLEDNKIKSFPIIVKSDNFGSGEVLEEIILKQDNESLKINIVSKGIGHITEGDILLASTSGAVIIGFNVKAPQKILALAKREQIEIKLYNVIYHLIEDLEKAIKGEIEPEYIENQIGQVEVLQKFKVSKIGIVAGCLVKEGKVTNKSKLRVMRNQDLVFEGEIETLRRIKDEVSEVRAGTECGIKIKNFNAIEINDILEVYELIIKK